MTVMFVTHFGRYGEIIDSVIMKDKFTSQPRGFGFITYSNPAVVDKVIEDIHVINGKQVGLVSLYDIYSTGVELQFFLEKIIYFTSCICALSIPEVLCVFLPILMFSVRIIYIRLRIFFKKNYSPPLNCSFLQLYVFFYLLIFSVRILYPHSR
jgi:RNA recognition motif-containing protein